ncbi:TetR family transcriptional regulator [Dactylosporangium sp. CA-092794]|uniref:TetR/AcrR family transcriptional regulator n=1 Tax=Dactylosporangium sp. CA-092794 TaxID=3239929 RepID=UPI003D90DFFE
MRTRDPETKRRLLLEAALEEFAESGVAGARIDRIARRAGISAGLIYSFYDNKDSLFEAVHDLIVEQTVATVPIDADSLPEYAAGLHDAAGAHPVVPRFLTWYRLERGAAATTRASTAAAMREKVEAIAAAQLRGTVSARYTPAQTLALVLAVANMWHSQAGESVDLVPAADRRATVVDAVRRLTQE